MSNNPERNPNEEVVKPKKDVYSRSNSDASTPMNSNKNVDPMSEDDSDSDYENCGESKKDIVHALKYQKVYTLEESFDRQGLCTAIAMLKQGLIQIGKQPSDKTMPDQRVKTWIQKLETLRDSNHFDTFKVTYRRAKLPQGEREGELFGRASAVGISSRVSSQTMPRKIRALVVGSIHYDVDMVNAHPVLLCSMFPKLTPLLKEYVEFRADWLKEVMDTHGVERNDAKVLFLKPLNCANPLTFYWSWCQEQRDNDGSLIRKELCQDKRLKRKYRALAKEIIQVRKHVLKIHPEYVFKSVKVSERAKKKNKVEHEGTYFNKWLCNEEQKAIQIVVKELKKQGLVVDAVIHDGCHIVKENGRTADVATINAALQKTWPLLTVKVKPFDMPNIPSDLKPEMRHPFNSCAHGSQNQVVTCDEIQHELKSAASNTYASLDEVYNKLNDICANFINLAFSQLSNTKPIVVQRLYGDFVEQANVHNDGTRRQYGRRKPRLVKYKEMTKTDAIAMTTKYMKHTFKYYDGLDDDGNPYINKKTFHALSYWYDSMSSNEYSDSVFNPDINNLPNDHLNRYAGYACEPSDLSFEECKEICAPWTAHVFEVWANNNREHYEYIITWLAHTVQFPHLKIGIGMVVLGEKRCGKGIIINFLLKIFGQHAAEITQGNHATGNFNAALIDRVLISMNEAVWGGDSKALGALRGMITDDSFMGTRKCKDTKAMKNFLDFLFSSNFDHVVCNKNGEQRYCFTRCNPKYSAQSKAVTAEEKTKHMDEIAAIPVPVVLKMLLNWPMPENKRMYLKRPPFTEAEQQQTECSMSTVQKYVLSCLRGSWPRNCVIIPLTKDDDGRKIEAHREDIEIWGQLVDKNKLFDHYKETYKGTANGMIKDASVFWRYLRADQGEFGCNLSFGKNQQPKVYNKNEQCIQFPTLEEAKKQFLELCRNGFVI